MRKFGILALVISGLLLAGCGGNGGSSTSLEDFIGIWTGTWEAPDFSTTGTVNLTVADDGTVSGTSTTDGFSGTGTITGTIDDDGEVTATLDWPGIPETTATGVLTTSGSQLNGSLTAPISGTDRQVSFMLTKQ